MLSGSLLTVRPQTARTSRKVIQSYNALKVRFSATLNQDPEVEIALACYRPPSWSAFILAIPEG